MIGFDLSSLARLDLRQIWVFTAEKWGRRKANNYLDEIRAAIEAVARDRDLGSFTDHLDADYRKMVVGSHAIFYRLVGGKVWIIRVLHQAMDAANHLN
ncbi:type II toxin-antitoxin system RelE/ParE family toxin [Caulobacter sp. DWR1-3-2b1]|uniref:type II toxin-antitoxin system RelE/ParE family toxin n=1 Tax=Caulobacter sp. DWR1-3-2b1 TaxID=2804670 RepID=UPI003CF51301